MALAATQSAFRAHMKDYLDQINDSDETVYVARTNNRAVAIISQEKMAWMERALKAKDGSLECAVARDQLIRRGILPDDEIVDSDDKYWSQFKNGQ